MMANVKDKKEQHKPAEGQRHPKHKQQHPDGGMDIDGIHSSWIKTMLLAGYEDQQIKEMFDHSGDIKKHINGWIMYFSEQQDMKDANDINTLLQHISEIKPLLINIDACENPRHVINRIIKRQHQQGL